MKPQIRLLQARILYYSYGQVGEQIYHVWECDDDTHGFLVHSCFVNDGRGTQFDLVGITGHFIRCFSCVFTFFAIFLCFVQHFYVMNLGNLFLGNHEIWHPLDFSWTSA